MLKLSPSGCDIYTTKAGVLSDLVMSSVGILYHFLGLLCCSHGSPVRRSWVWGDVCFLPPFAFLIGGRAFPPAISLGIISLMDQGPVWCTVPMHPCLWVSQTPLKEESSLEFLIPRSEDSGAEVVIAGGRFNPHRRVPWWHSLDPRLKCLLSSSMNSLGKKICLPSAIPSVWDEWWFSLKPFSMFSSPAGLLHSISKSPASQLWLFMWKWLSYTKGERLTFYFDKY